MPTSQTASRAQVSRRHHSIARFHLQRFTPSMKRHDHLFVLDLLKFQWESKKPKEVAWGKDAYAIELPHIPPDILESEFDRAIETPASGVFGEIEASQRLPAASRLELLLRYLALIVARNPAVIDSWATSVRQLGEVMKELYIHHERPDLDPAKFRVTAARNSQMHFLLRRVDDLTDLFCSREWRLLVAEEDAGHFICGDRPFTLFWGPEVPPKVPSTMRPGFGLRKTVVLAPISHKLCLCGFFAGDAAPKVADHGLIAQHNTVMLGSADRYIYSPEPDFRYMGSDGRVELISSQISEIQTERTATGDSLRAGVHT